MALQTTYNAEPGEAFAGMLEHTGFKDIPSLNIEGDKTNAADNIAFGEIAVRGAADFSCRKFAAGDSSADFIGFFVRQQAIAAEVPNGLTARETAAVLIAGSIWVTVADAVSNGDLVRIGTSGGIRSDAGELFPDAYFETSAAAGGLAVVRLK